MHIAYTMAPGKGDVDLLLARLAQRLDQRGLRTCGVVQVNTDCGGDGPCDMDVRVLPDGPVFRISQTLGKHARGCRLDPDALERAVAEVEGRLDDRTDLLIVNKFGKHEAEGRGFRALIGAAIAQGTPVVVGVNGLNALAFQEFTGGIAVEVPPDCDALEDWAIRTASENVQTA